MNMNNQSGYNSGYSSRGPKRFCTSEYSSSVVTDYTEGSSSAAGAAGGSKVKKKRIAKKTPYTREKNEKKVLYDARFLVQRAPPKTNLKRYRDVPEEGPFDNASKKHRKQDQHYQKVTYVPLKSLPTLKDLQVSADTLKKDFKNLTHLTDGDSFLVRLTLYIFYHLFTFFLIQSRTVVIYNLIF